MVTRRLARGAVGYYWVPPTWAVRAGCKMRGEALGLDLAGANRRCDDLLNPQFDAWRTKGEEVLGPKARQGTFDWMAELSFRSKI